MASVYALREVLSSAVIVGLVAFTPPSKADVVPAKLADLKDPFETVRSEPYQPPAIRVSALDLIDPFSPSARVDVKATRTARGPTLPRSADLRDPFAN
jgi:hypothetical protein